MANPLKKTMVFLGLAEDNLEDERPQAQAAQAQRETVQVKPAPQAQVKPAQRPQVAPLRKVTPTRPQAQEPLSEILTVHPAGYSEAKPIAESFREGVPVIINLSRMQQQEARRLIDFACGLTMGLDGKIERITSKVYLLSPAHVAVAGDDTAKSAGDTFFVQQA